MAERTLRRGGDIFCGYRGTPIEVRDGAFQRCLFDGDSFTPGAKERELSRILERPVESA